jgi:hypothetical protein
MRSIETEKKKLKTTIQIWLKTFWHYHIELIEENDYFVLLWEYDLILNEDERESFLDELTKLFDDIKQKKTYRYIVPNWYSLNFIDYKNFKLNDGICIFWGLELDDREKAEYGILY